jgi:hypothetical protein
MAMTQKQMDEAHDTTRGGGIAWNPGVGAPPCVAIASGVLAHPDANQRLENADFTAVPRAGNARLGDALHSWAAQ